MDLDINRIINFCRTKPVFIQKCGRWFIRHYYYCDLHFRSFAGEPNLAHSGLGVVINKDAVIEGDVTIQHHVTVGSNQLGVPHICKGAYLGAHSIILGKVRIGENAIVGAGAVVVKNVADNVTVVGNPAHPI